MICFIGGECDGDVFFYCVIIFICLEGEYIGFFWEGVFIVLGRICVNVVVVVMLCFGIVDCDEVFVLMFNFYFLGSMFLGIGCYCVVGNFFFRVIVGIVVVVVIFIVLLLVLFYLVKIYF